MGKFLQIPILQIRPSMLLAYEIPAERPTKRDKGHQSKLELFKSVAAYSGLINTNSQKKLKHAINLLVAISKWKTAFNPETNSEFKFKVNFITLTLPGPQGTISDKTIKKECLDVWLKMAKRRWKLGSYVWRAERQHNGNIHFHFITDTFIPYDQLRDSWNERVNRLGFIDRFEAKHGHRNPNSTDVHAVQKIAKLAAYVCKYMAKGSPTPQQVIAQAPWAKPRMILKPNKRSAKFKRLLSIEEQRIDGKIWDCSTNLKAKDRCDMILEADAVATWNFAAKAYPDDVKIGEKCSIIFIPPGQLIDSLKGEVKKAWLAYLDRIRSIPDRISQPKQKHNANRLQTLPARLEDAHSSVSECPF